MKIRNGFVSNSSSSSFCIYGKTLKLENLLELATKLKVKYKKSDFKKDEEDNYINEEIGDSMYELASAVGEKVKLPVHFFHDYDGSLAYIGRDYSGLGDDETGRQFRASVEEVLGDGCEHIEETIDS